MIYEREKLYDAQKRISEIKKPFYGEVITPKTWAMTHAYVSNKGMTFFYKKACIFMAKYGFAYKAKVKSSAKRTDYSIRTRTNIFFIDIFTIITDIFFNFEFNEFKLNLIIYSHDSKHLS